MDEETKQDIQKRIEALRRQREELIATLHAVDGAIAALGGLLEETVKREVSGEQ